MSGCRGSSYVCSCGDRMNSILLGCLGSRKMNSGRYVDVDKMKVRTNATCESGAGLSIGAASSSR